MHTLELTEMGFSMLAWPEGPRVVFNALVESFFADVEHTAADAERLASTRPTQPKIDLLGTASVAAVGGRGATRLPCQNRRRARSSSRKSQRKTAGEPSRWWPHAC